jgi:hypothetical protein
MGKGRWGTSAEGVESMDIEFYLHKRDPKRAMQVSWERLSGILFDIWSENIRGLRMSFDLVLNGLKVLRPNK